MKQHYVALLRAITNVGMRSFRKKMERMGFTDVKSYGMSGNLIFNSKRADSASLESRIAARMRTATVVRTRRDLARTAAWEPFGSVIRFLTRAPTAARRRAFLRLEMAAPRPVLRGKNVFFKSPATLRGKRTPINFEWALGVQGTARSARVVCGILAQMAKL